MLGREPARLARYAPVFLACAYLVYCVRCIIVQSPYPVHADEHFIMEHAWQVVYSGDLNPHFFHYGSFPIYLTALALRVGAWLEQLRGQLPDLNNAGPICFPYYAHPLVSNAARLLFTFFGSLSLIALAWLARALRARLEAMVTPILVLAFTPLFQEHSITYINVDILVTALITSALAYLAYSWESESFAARALIPACFCGAALATKYNAGLLMLPFACTAARPPWRRSLAQLATLGLATLAVFLVCQPYTLLAFEEVSADVVTEINHYRSGHAGHDAEPGIPQVIFYAQTFYAQWGAIVWALVALGVYDGIRRQRRLTLLVLSFPVASFAFMIQQRVHFPRNLLPALAVLSTFAGLGVCRLVDLATAAAARSTRTRALPGWALSASCVLVLVGGMALSPWLAPAGALARPRSDSRTKLARWFHQNTQPGRCTVLVPAELGLKPDTIEPHCALRTYSVNDGTAAEQLMTELATLRAQPDSYLALAAFSVPRGSDPATADAANGLREQLQLEPPLKRFGSNRVRLGRRAAADPKVALYRLSAP